MAGCFESAELLGVRVVGVPTLLRKGRWQGFLQDGRWQPRGHERPGGVLSTLVGSLASGENKVVAVPSSSSSNHGDWPEHSSSRTFFGLAGFCWKPASSVNRRLCQPGMALACPSLPD